MMKPQKRGQKPTITLFRNHPKIDTQIINRIYVEASEEMSVLYMLQEMGGKATSYQLKRRIPDLTRIQIDQALKRQYDAGNVWVSMERGKMVWELV